MLLKLEKAYRKMIARLTLGLTNLGVFLTSTITCHSPPFARYRENEDWLFLRASKPVASIQFP